MLDFGTDEEGRVGLVGYFRGIPIVVPRAILDDKLPIISSFLFFSFFSFYVCSGVVVGVVVIVGLGLVPACHTVTYSTGSHRPEGGSGYRAAHIKLRNVQIRISPSAPELQCLQN